MDEIVGRYRLLERIGTGGLGEVYRARDTSLGRTVALKLPWSGAEIDPARRTQLLAAAETAASLSHPNIAGLLDFGEDRGQLFLAFEYAPGDSLRSLIGDRPLNVRRALDIAIQIADALGVAQERRITHGDLRPANIKVSPNGRPKILDFGLTAWTLGAQRRSETKSNPDAAHAAQTIAYMAPEELRGEPGEHRSDIFALGVILYEMLTGTHPFAGSTSTEMQARILEATPAPLARGGSEMPPRLAAAIGRALSKTAEGRYQHVLDFQRELRFVATTLNARTADAPPATVLAPNRARKSPAALVAAVLAALAALAVLTWFFART